MMERGKSHSVFRIAMIDYGGTFEWKSFSVRVGSKVLLTFRQLDAYNTQLPPGDPEFASFSHAGSPGGICGGGD
jgi:hypothetical protein